MKRHAPVAIVFVASVAHAAPDAKECAAAYESAQRLRNEAHLLKAREQALVCADDACPRFVRQDCARWVDEIDKVQPTIVVHAIGADGCDVVDAAIAIDDRPVDASMRGRPIPLDPGSHTVRADAIEQKVVVVQGERDRRIDLSAAPAGTACGAIPARETHVIPLEVPAPAPEKKRSVPTAAWILGGIGIGGLVAGSAFGIGGFVQRSNLESCKPACNPSDVDATRRTFAASDILFGVAIATLVAATVVWLLR